MTNRVLITGADGFVGKAVCRRLLKSGLTPRAGLRNASLWPALKAATPGLHEFATIGDLGANPDLRSALEDVSAVVHLAARVYVMNDTALNPLHEFQRVNVGGTAALARAAAAEGVRRFVFVSTVKVNGESTAGRPFTEGDLPAPQDPYAVSKWEAEEVLRGISAETGLEVAIIRPPLVYGPGVRANFLRLMRLVERGLPLPLPNTNNRRSLIGVENLADCLVRCVMHPGAANHTFMVSDGQDVSTRELVVRLAPSLGRSARFLPVPELALRLAARLVGKQSAINRLLGSLEIDSSNVRRTLEWEPPVTFSCGLEATARWYLDSFKQLV
jgi:nucleoside-diphosphate-sugar epimerase